MSKIHEAPHCVVPKVVLYQPDVYTSVTQSCIHEEDVEVDRKEYRSRAGRIRVMHLGRFSFIFRPRDRVSSLGIPCFTQSLYKTALNVYKTGPQTLPSKSFPSLLLHHPKCIP